jgi:sarcosine oxidase delta subunit
MIPYPGCESAIRCPSCGQTRHSAQFPYIGEHRSRLCMFCQPQKVSPPSQTVHTPASNNRCPVCQSWRHSDGSRVNRLCDACKQRLIK